MTGDAAPRPHDCRPGPSEPGWTDTDECRPGPSGPGSTGASTVEPARLRWSILYGAGAYSLWGLFPIYFKQTARVPALEVLAHRIVWSLLALALIALATRGRSAALRAPARVVALYALAAALIGVNWFVYVWAVSSGFILETSLGYFITPLVNVGLGVAVLRERLRPGQWLAIGLAAAGVAYLTLTHGSLPWISLVLALSFGSYGLVKKQAPLGSVQGVTLETGVLFVPALVYLVLLETRGAGSFLHAGARIDLLLAASGVITIVPLLMFSKAVVEVPLSIIGMLQYIAPTIQFLLGVLVYDEPFTRDRLVGFVFVWVALAVFSADRLQPPRGLRPPSRGVRPPSRGIRPPSRGLRPPSRGVRPPSRGIRPPSRGVRPPSRGVRL